MRIGAARGGPWAVLETIKQLQAENSGRGGTAETPTAPSASKNVLDHFFGGGVPTGLLGENDTRRARKQGLLGAGAAMLEASDTKGLGATIGAGIRGGQEGYSGSAATALAAREMQQQQEMQRRRDEIFSQTGARPGESTQQRVSRLSALLEGLLSIGDYQAARSLAEIIKPLAGGESREPGTWVTVPGPDGKPRRRYVTAGEAGSEGIPVAEGTGSQAAERLVTLATPEGPRVHRFDPNTGEFINTGREPATNREQPTEAERKAELLRQSMTYALPQLDAADAPSRVEALARRGGLREMLTSEEQKNMIAGLVVAEAWLRLTSGAAITPDEVRESAIKLTPLPGDTPETIAYKRGLRQRIAQAIANYARRATPMTAAPVASPEMPSLDSFE